MKFFGLINAFAYFREYINKIPAKKLDFLVIVYLDNILIYTQDSGRIHVNAVLKEFDVLRKNGLFANFKKWLYYKNKVRF